MKETVKAMQAQMEELASKDELFKLKGQISKTITRLTPTSDDLFDFKAKQITLLEKTKGNISQINITLGSLEENIKETQDQFNAKLAELQASFEKVSSKDKDKTTILNIPTGGFDDGTKKIDEDFIVDAIDKLRVFFQAEVKHVRDDMFKLQVEFENKNRAKLDRAELEEIEKRINEAVELEITNRTKKYVDKPELKKVAKAFDKQVENLYALV